MRIKLVFAYVMTVLIWSTTALAIQWSQDSLGSIQALFWRMFISLLIVTLWLAYQRRLPKPNRQNFRLFSFSGGGMFIAMMLIYRASPHIDTALVAIIHGLIPLFSALFALWILDTRIALRKWLALLISFSGIALLFKSEQQLSDGFGSAFFMVFVAVMVHALSGVLIKRHAVNISVGHQLFGALLIVSVCLFLSLVFSSETLIPSQVSVKSAASLLYLAVVGSVVAFFLYYYLLQAVSPVTASTITLLTPLLSMLVGMGLNGEHFPTGTLLGTVILLAGLGGYLWQERPNK